MYVTETVAAVNSYVYVIEIYGSVKEVFEAAAMGVDQRAS
jgi:hypothetical protein